METALDAKRFKAHHDHLTAASSTVGHAGPQIEDVDKTKGADDLDGEALTDDGEKDGEKDDEKDDESVGDAGSKVSKGSKVSPEDKAASKLFALVSTASKQSITMYN